MKKSATRPAAAKTAPKEAPEATEEAASVAATTPVPGATSSGSATFENGVLELSSPHLMPGMEAVAYVGAYTVGRGTVEGDGGQVRIAVEDFPQVDYPFEIRFAESNSGHEVFPPFIVPNPLFAQQRLGAEDLTATIATVFDDELGFEVRVSRLTHCPRAMRLLVNGKLVSEETTVPPLGKKTAGRPHTITFPLSSPLRDGVALELIDAATGKVAFSRAATWLNLVGGVMRGQQMLSQRVRELETALEKATSQLASMSKQTGERLLMDRLDLFYSLIQDRLDRELRTLESTISPAPPLPLRDPGLQDVIIDAAQIEGVGFYHLESSGDNRWRWFGPHTTLVFREVSSQCKAMQLTFSSVPEECDASGIAIRINARAVDAQIERTGERVTAVVPFGPGFFSSARASALIVEIDIPHRFQVGEDTRVLSAAFAAATFRF